MTNELTMQWKGIAASPGYAIARALVLNKERYVPERLNVANSAEEQSRFVAAVGLAAEELDAIRQSTLEKLGAAKAEIFEGHLMLLRDPELVDVIIENIGQEGINAEYALHEVAQMFIETFMGLDNELLRARAVDIRDVSDRIMNKLRGVSHTNLATLNEECVIIAEDLTPSDTAGLNLRVVKGIVSEIGSRTSHSAIMARSLGIPAIVGAGAMDIVSGSFVIVDAIEGIVFVQPSAEQLEEYQGKLRQYELKMVEFRKLKDLPTITADGHQVELAANIGNLEDLEKVLDHGAEAIGLFRTEFLYMDRNGFPSEDEQFEVYKFVLEKMNNKPVVIRTFDIGGDKELSYMELPKESNPFLGLRALRLCFKHEELFRIQLRALLRASVHGNLKIMFPMIAVIEEWRKAKMILLEEKAKLQDQGVRVSEQLEIGMMVEVPAAALSADIFAREVDFFSIGTNDLIQYTMAADRMNESVSYLYQPCHPTILKLVHMVIEAAKKQGKWVGMCGEMAGDATAIPLLLGLGLHEFSMSASSILPSRQLIGYHQYKKLISVAAHALTFSSQQEVLQYVSAYIEEERGDVVW
jgi:phosphotransferase system enzyme I (PtsI)